MAAKTTYEEAVAIAKLPESEQPPTVLYPYATAEVRVGAIVDGRNWELFGESHDDIKRSLLAMFAVDDAWLGIQPLHLINMFTAIEKRLHEGPGLTWFIEAFGRLMNGRRSITLALHDHPFRLDEQGQPVRVPSDQTVQFLHGLQRLHPAWTSVVVRSQGAAFAEVILASESAMAGAYNVTQAMRRVIMDEGLAPSTLREDQQPRQLT